MTKKNNGICHHLETELEFAPEAYDDTNVRRIVLRSRCAACKEPQRFIGVDEGMSLSRPCTSTDGFTLFIPVVMGFDDVETVRRLHA